MRGLIILALLLASSAHATPADTCHCAKKPTVIRARPRPAIHDTLRIERIVERVLPQAVVTQGSCWKKVALGSVAGVALGYLIGHDDDEHWITVGVPGPQGPAGPPGEGSDPHHPRGHHFGWRGHHK